MSGLLVVTNTDPRRIKYIKNDTYLIGACFNKNQLKLGKVDCVLTLFNCQYQKHIT